MRQIKFRAWDGSKFHEWGFIGDAFAGPPSGNANGGFNPLSCPHLQYTGLKDKNGVDIYEGDILRVWEYEGYEPDELDICIVRWNDDFAGFTCASIMRGPEGVSCEVIGNIYQDKGLIE